MLGLSVSMTCGEDRGRRGRKVPCEPQWYWEISSGREQETRSVMPTTKSTAARKDKDGDWVSKERVKGCRLLVMFLLQVGF